ncbi:hypothetical protein A3E49_03870 [Candidatus Saccharibacteria bacterium RIFCSPHIGHO2_12_FULL_49_19]|nr:MAG: hypothetical protein A3E49_03870 [Candidatus Saccharibacteria bacterium RIFCSPHIGHO2_12_FULL_49_19]OGL37665.1 MAG: hypothetical protein A3B63_03035 [Candidatus Saccharibacteria bacterium RIFCSPLOWO2_01_FULL_49_22]
MSSHETEHAVEPSGDVDPVRQAEDLCFRLKAAAERIRWAETQLGNAYAEAERVRDEIASLDQPFRLLVTIPEGVKSRIRKRSDVIEDNPRIFEADQVWNIDEAGVEFRDWGTDRVLAINGHQFDLTPIFDETAPSDGPTPSVD